MKKLLTAFAVVLLFCVVPSFTAQAVVSTATVPRVVYDGNGSNTTFPIMFQYAGDESLVVVVHVDASLNETTWVNGGTGSTGYNIISGSAEANTAPATNETLIIYRATPQLQGTDLRENRRLPAETEEAMFDKLTFMVQENDEANDRAARLPITADTDIDPSLPLPSADMLLGWSSSGLLLENKADLSAYSVTTWAESLLDDASSDAARITIPSVLHVADATALAAASGDHDGQPCIKDDDGTIYIWDDGGTDKWKITDGSVFATLPSHSTYTVVEGTEVYDSTDNIRFQSTGSAWVDNSTPRGYIDGLNLTYTSATSFTVTEGIARSDDDTSTLRLTSSMTKTTAYGTWVVGTGNDGLDTGSLSNPTWYHVFVIDGPEIAADVIFSLSPTSPTMPSADYTKSRRIGSIYNGALATLSEWYQRGDYFDWDTPVSIHSGTYVAGAKTTISGLQVPPDIETNYGENAGILARISVTYYEVGGTFYMKWYHPDRTDIASATNFNIATTSYNAHALIDVPVGGTNDQEISYYATTDGNAGDETVLLGYVDPRGKNAD